MKKLLLLSYRNFFLLDGIGAIVTAFMLAVVLGNFQPIFGMPNEILYWLAGAAVCFAFYSFSCYLFLKGNWKPFLQVIAIANTAYCLMTLMLGIVHRECLTLLGAGYFVGEIIVVMTLVRFEWMKVNETNNEI